MNKIDDPEMSKGVRHDTLVGIRMDARELARYAQDIYMAVEAIADKGLAPPEFNQWGDLSNVRLLANMMRKFYQALDEEADKRLKNIE
jgi:hypothetical protein